MIADDYRNLALIQAKTEIGWRDVAAARTFEQAERFAVERQRRSGVEHRACNSLPSEIPVLPVLSDEQLSEGDACEERR